MMTPQALKKDLKKHSFCNGVSMLELLITLAVLFVLVSIAAPNFSDLIKRNKYQSTLQELVAFFARCRSESIKQNKPVSIFPIGADETDVKAWGQGFIMWSDIDGDSAYDSSEEIYRFIPANNIMISTDASIPTFAFHPSGRVDTDVSFNICQANIEIGSSLRLSPGSATINLKDKTDCET